VDVVAQMPEQGQQQGGGQRGASVSILREQVYRGPNVWSRQPAINLTLDVAADEPNGQHVSLPPELLEIVPSLRPDAVSSLPQLVLDVALGLQLYATGQQQQGHVQRSDVTTPVRLIFGYSDEGVALRGGRLAVRIVQDLIDETTAFDGLRAAVDDMVRFADRSALGVSTRMLVEEASARGIPWSRLDERSLVQFGHGAHQRRIRGSLTSLTPALGVQTAENKPLTAQLLRSVGLPVAERVEVSTADDAVAAATRLGFPVVVKTIDGNRSNVSLGLMSGDDVRAAVGRADQVSRRGGVLVERQVDGRSFRFLVVGGRVAAIAERVGACVVGDGASTIRQLVAMENEDPRRGIGRERELTRISLDEAAAEMLGSQGFTFDDIPDAGCRVSLTRTAHMSTGGTSIDRTLESHPDNVEAAEEATRVVGLDTAGVDIVIADITRSVRDTGAIIDIDPAPGFRMHTHPTAGDPQYVAKPVIDQLFPPGTSSRIPIVAVTGTNGKTTTTRMIGHILKSMGRRVGMTSTDGIFVDQRRIAKYDAAGPQSARMILQNPRVDFALFEVARGGILREGLGYRSNDVAVVLNVAPDHLGLDGIDTLEQLAAVKRVIVGAVPPEGTAVLNADDPLVEAMASFCEGSTMFFTMNESSAVVDAHCRVGGRAMVLEDDGSGDTIVFRDGTRRLRIVRADEVPATFGGRARMNIQNAMAAASAAMAAGASLDDIRHGLRTFDTSFFVAPGRLNVTEFAGATVVIDYAHNAAAMRRLGDFVDRLADSQPNTPRRLGVIATPGDRRDEDLRENGAAAAQHFDTLIIHENRLRGKEAGETASIVEAGVRGAMASGARCSTVEVVLDLIEACDHLLSLLRPGDIGVMCVDRAQDAWNLIEQRRFRTNTA
jgi:cyanophycin synthetase